MIKEHPRFTFHVSHFIILIGIFALALNAQANQYKATIFYNEACGACLEYVHETLPRVLSELGVQGIVKKDYINERQNRVLLNNLIETLNIPLSMESHIMTFVDEVDSTKEDTSTKIILAGHIPEQLVRELFAEENQALYEKIVILQDEMHKAPVQYSIWGFLGEIKEYPIDTPVSVYLNWLKLNPHMKGGGISPSETKGEAQTIQSLPFGKLMPIVLGSGLSDGINPCAIAVLIFFIALLYKLKRTTKNILGMGVLYISIIYLTYLAIGLGLFKAVRLSNQPHLMAKIGSYLLIALGAINVKDFFFPKLPISLKTPKIFHKSIENWLSKATIPAVGIGAFLVGLCTFPCSGGIYVAIIGLLASTAPMKGLGYLLVYNLMFVMPLVGILIISSRRVALWGAVARLQRRNEDAFRLSVGVLMILLGVVILVFFV
ncbi:MAG: cytochrome c biogenesis CcdA family protein [Candidatus Poribacteria bacterium]